MRKLNVFILIWISAFTGCKGSAEIAPINPDPPSQSVRLLFIHHSCGGNWLSDGNGGLGIALNANNYFVSESDYGWDAEYDYENDVGDNLGDRTDTANWPEWFSDVKMPYVYDSNFHSAYDSNTMSEPTGENEIIMFKSCYPLSEVGSSITDEQTIYTSLLEYFAQHTDKLFILITPPGETVVSSASLTRQLCTWLVDEENGWLKDYAHNNVGVYDFYGTLSEVGSHHRIVNSAIEHVYASDYDGISPYHNGDNHPDSIGNKKATVEYLPILNFYYNRWKGNN